MMTPRAKESLLMEYIPLYSVSSGM